MPGGPGSGLVFNVGYCGSHSSRMPAFGGCSFLRDGRAVRHSAVQRIPRSHSSASLRSRSALALSCAARASLRYRIARALLMASQIPTQQNEDSSTGKKIWFGAVHWHAVRQKGSPGTLLARNSRTHQRPSWSRAGAIRRFARRLQVQARNREARAALLG